MLRTPTGLVLVTLGATMLLAVHVRVGFVAAQPAGLVLLVTGVAWLWLPVQGKSALVRRLFMRMIAALEGSDITGGDDRCSLADLLEPRTAPTASTQSEARSDTATVAQHDG